jgi:hypothetical protein
MKVFTVKMGTDMSACPDCHSEDVENLAAHHGHGECCLDADAQA